jgi:hypothetical protein
MRNPTGAIEFGMEQSLGNLRKHFKKFKALKSAFQKYIDYE